MTIVQKQFVAIDTKNKSGFMQTTQENLNVITNCEISLSTSLSMNDSKNAPFTMTLFRNKTKLKNKP